VCQKCGGNANCIVLVACLRHDADDGVEDQDQARRSDAACQDDEPLDGRVEMDDAYLGGQRCVGKSARLKIRRIARFKRRRVKQLAKRIIAVGATVVTYGLSCFRGLADAGCDHIALPTESGRRAVQHASFQWVNRMIINIKTAVVGTYKSVSKKHMVRTLAEFEWRFNHRENLPSMIPVLACARARTKPKPY
jgi:hypothetical protein